MKRFLFTMMTLVALVLVANTTYALNDTQVYPKGAYDYSLSAVSVSTANATGAAITFSGFDTNPSVSSFNPSVGTTPAALTFTLTYDANESADAGNKIIVTITDGGASGCTNFIELAIEVLAAPTMTITIADASDYGCQNLNASPADNTDATVGATQNSFNFTITAGASPTGLDSYSYDFDVTETGSLGVASSSTLSSDGAQSVSWNTAEGGGSTITGTISNATFTLDAANGGATYDMTITSASDDVVVGPVPTIGSF